MVNLVPKEVRVELIAEYRKRRLVIGLSLIVVIFLISISLMASFYATLYLQERTVDNMLAENRKQAEDEGFGETAEIVSQTNKRSDLVVNYSADSKGQVRPSVMIRKIKDSANRGFSFDSFKWNVGQEEIKISVNGSSPSRSDLIDYVNILEEDPLIKSVESPVTNLIQGENKSFSLTITLN